MEQTISERLAEILKSKRYSVNALSKELDINQKTLNNQLSGKSALSVDVVCAIAKRFPDLSTDWILFGREPMQRPGQNDKEQPEMVELLQKLLEEEKERSDKYWETIQKLINK
jgi:transcriptional regulator with XRE-family HTH domain